ncbi:MAG: TolC family protein [Bacteroidetes bacterium]|nr:TolC family protein [Bacteroidota bacterium]
MVKKQKLTIFLALLPILSIAQSVSRLELQQAYEQAQKNYPVIQQKDLVRQTAAINIDNLQKGLLPQVTLSGQASYQTDVTKVGISVPGFSIEPPSKDQYKLVADVSQLIYDGGITREQKTMLQLSATVEDQKIEVELYKLKERINQVFMGILYLDEQLKQTELVKADINTGMKKVEAQVKNGVAFRSNLNMLKAELLKAEQRVIELSTSRKGLLDVLALFTGQPLDEKTILVKPAVSAVPTADIARPELKLYSAQSGLFDQQQKLIHAKNLPKASLFVQGGYGRPALNLLKNEFDFFAIGGLRLNWSLGGLYTKKKEKELTEVNKRIVETQKQTFLLNTNTQLKQQEAEIKKWQQLSNTDNEIISLRESVKEAAKAQLENGVITASDYLREVNAEDQARQSLITHQLQLLQAQLNYNTISGKQ